MIIYPIIMNDGVGDVYIHQDEIVFDNHKEPIRLANGSEEECIQGHINCLYTRGYEVVDECKTTVMKLFKYQSRFLWK